MGKWYRALVTFIAAASAFCVASLAYAGFELWQAGEEQRTVRSGNSFEWSDGLYEATGVLEDGAILEVTIRRKIPELPG